MYTTLLPRPSATSQATPSESLVEAVEGVSEEISEVMP